MKHYLLTFALASIAFPLWACPPSAPLLDDVPEAKRVGDYKKDREFANASRDKLFTRCYEQVDNPCVMQCDAQSLALYRYQEGDVHYLHSASERKEALKTVNRLLKKWNASPSKGDASVGITAKR